MNFAAFVIIYDIDTIIMGPLFNNFFTENTMEMDDAHKKAVEKKHEEDDGLPHEDADYMYSEM